MSMVLTVLLMTSSGGLLSERAATTGLLMGADFDAAALEAMSVPDLMTERARLLDERPSVALGVSLTVAGAAVLVVGLAFIYVAPVIALIIMAISVPLLILGPIFWVKAARERRDIQLQLRIIDRRLDQLRNTGYPAPPGNEVPPPPPPRPDSVMAPFEPQLLLATF